MNIKNINELLERLSNIVESDTSTPLEIDLAECLDVCVHRIGQLEGELVNAVLDKDEKNDQTSHRNTM